VALAVVEEEEAAVLDSVATVPLLAADREVSADQEDLGEEDTAVE
jgi:hypothetical protein